MRTVRRSAAPSGGSKVSPYVAGLTQQGGDAQKGQLRLLPASLQEREEEKEGGVREGCRQSILIGEQGRFLPLFCAARHDTAAQAGTYSDPPATETRSLLGGEKRARMQLQP